MITTRVPDDWRDLQQEVANILRECGFGVEVEKTVPLARGNVEVDVYAEEIIKGRKYSIFCECKHWKARVPQNIIHAFRTVVTDSGSNLGYIISKGGFQSGAFTSAELTNIRLVTWEQFQQEFEETWFANYLLPFVADRLDPLLTYTEPLLPKAFGELTEPEKKEFLALKDKYDDFGWLLMAFTPYTHALAKQFIPIKLPLRSHFTTKFTNSTHIPGSVLDAIGYREFLNAAIEYGDAAITQFRNVLKKDST